MIVEDLVTMGFEAPFRIIGHSLGGNVALHYSSARPDRVSHLVAIEGLGFSQGAYDKVMAKSAPERLYRS